MRRTRVSRGILWLAAGVFLLCFCMVTTVPSAAIVVSTRIPGAGGVFLHSLTLGAVACPYSAITGWTLGHDWSAVTNVVTCPQSGSLAPAVWLQLWWRDGTRTSLCYDFGGQRC